jgi:hypothetical protein
MHCTALYVSNNSRTQGSRAHSTLKAGYTQALVHTHTCTEQNTHWNVYHRESVLVLHRAPAHTTRLLPTDRAHLNTAALTHTLVVELVAKHDEAGSCSQSDEDRGKLGRKHNLQRPA